MENDQDLEGIVVFGGSLEELNSVSKDKFKIAGAFFQSDCLDLNILEKTKRDLESSGYDGLIHANFASAKGPINYLTGVPIKKI